MNHSHTLLGRYAVLQHDISAQLTDYRQTQNDKNAFFARFNRPHSSAKVTGDKANQTEAEKLTSLTKASHDNLFVAQTIFPFVLFADTIKIDRQKVTIVHNDFFFTSQTASVEIRNIMNIEVDVGPLFGSITITSKHFRNNSQTIKYLRRSAVNSAQRLLQGFMIAQRARINTDNINTEQLLTLLNDLGQENRA